MPWPRPFRLLRSLLNRRQQEQELSDEVESWFEIHKARRIAQDMSAAEAMRSVRLEHEGPEQVKEKVREVRMGTAIETTLQDLRYASRGLRRSPGFTLVAVLTLALGIGANTAIFGLINAVMLRLLPVERPDQLVLLTDPASSGTAVDTTERGVRARLSYPEFVELRAHNTVFSGLLAAQNYVSSLDLYPSGNQAAQPTRVRAQLVSGEFFPVLGVRPVMGRLFTPEEDRVPGANPVAVLSYDFWKTHYASRPDIVGTTVRVGQAIFQIIGVAPAGFHGILVGANADVWFPMTMQAQVLTGRDYLKPRDTLWLQVIGRLSPGVSPQKAEAALNVTFQQILRAWGGDPSPVQASRSIFNQKFQLRPGSRGASDLRGQFADPLVLLMAMVGVVLLIACANIANLMLARANSRQREIGVRLALGAARSRLIRQLLTESLLISLMGGLLGILLAAAGTRLLLTLVSAGVSDLGLEVPNDYSVLAFTAALSLATSLAFGLAPAIRATRLNLNRTLVANGRSSIGGQGRVQAGRLLVVAQVALSLVLLMGATLFVRSLHNLLSENLGFSQDHLLMVRVDPVSAGYKGPAASELYNRVRAGLLTVPGVREVTFSNVGLFGGDSGDHLSIEGSPIHDRERLASSWTEVGPNYFRTLGIPLLRGREIDAADAGRGTQVCVINESFLRTFFPDSDALGKHITDEYPTTRETFEIVGVVADSREHRPNEPRQPRFYSNLAHPIGSVESVTFLIRSAGDPGGVAPAVRRSIQQSDPNLPVLAERTITEQLDRELITERLVAQLAAFFGAVALFMAALGLYGVMSYSTSQRNNEIGIRMALGASGSSVVRMVLREALGMVTFGAAIGLPAALVLGRLIATRLYGLTAADPGAITLATAFIVTAALCAAYLPARRASRIDPMISLRAD